MKHQSTQIIVPDSSSFNLKKTTLTPETYKIHSHKNYELNYIINGWGTRIIGDNIESFSRGDLVIIGPNLPHCWEVKGVSQGLTPECITIHFHENFLGHSIIKSPELQPMYSLLEESGLGIQFFGEETLDAGYILHKMLKANSFRRLIYLLEIFELLIRTKDSKVLAKAGYLEGIKNTNNEKLTKVYEYILVNFTKKVYLSEVADLCYMSSSAFCRFFEGTTGKPLFNYLKEVRIGYACKLLQESDLSISDICYQSGYNNLAHFNNQFKEICSVSPGQYRKNIKSVGH
ncbi:MAG: AraC family transcriptional regulator [Bacteroidales bacterium]|nr:AraC family transcriptional regulator [Bacteroidales bacterium]MCF8391303.1 AraC family transcriptional regulator [Bacteroidales bacterium]